ncbi:MAG: 1-acylglycerol-3-phosphate O-acyltransferase [Betaproteobacteria bacterium]|nr:1-acylglycerol-3-phosphate O-acyltransferase [Betaproteobacteria bacterium]
MNLQIAQDNTLKAGAQRQTRSKWLGYSIACYVWTIVPLLTVFFATLTVVMTPVAIVLDKRRNLLHRIASGWARSIVKCNPWWTFEIHGTENLPPKDLPVVYVANHQSQADILTVFLLNRQFRWLAKDSLFKVPFLGWAMRAVGYVPVKRGDRHSAVECFRKSREHLDRGTSMLFFPEGTRSRDGALQTFKNGAFRLASEAQCAIVPITLEGANDLLPKGSIIPAVATVRMTIHPMISSPGKSEEELMAAARNSIGSALGK